MTNFFQTLFGIFLATIITYAIIAFGIIFIAVAVAFIIPAAPIYYTYLATSDK